MDEDVFIYQTLHTLRGQIYHLEEHLKTLFEAYYQVFSGYVRLDRVLIEAQISEAIARNRCPRQCSLFVTIALSARGEFSIVDLQRSLYEGYTLRCVSPRAALIEFELPHVEYPTSIRYSLTQFANTAATKRGGDIALRSYSGHVDLANCAQLFGVVDQRVITSADSYSVEHKIAKGLLPSLGLTLVERPLFCGELSEIDELFYVDHAGVTAIRSCGGRHYTSITADSLADMLLTASGGRR